MLMLMLVLVLVLVLMLMLADTGDNTHYEIIPHTLYIYVYILTILNIDLYWFYLIFIFEIYISNATRIYIYIYMFTMYYILITVFITTPISLILVAAKIADEQRSRVVGEHLQGHEVRRQRTRGQGSQLDHGQTQALGASTVPAQHVRRLLLDAGETRRETRRSGSDVTLLRNRVVALSLPHIVTMS